MSATTEMVEKLPQDLLEGDFDWADALINLLIKIDNDIYGSIKELTKGSTVNLENYTGFIPLFFYYIDRRLYFLLGNSSLRHTLMDIMFVVFENNKGIWWKHLTSSPSIETKLNEFLNQKVKYYHDLALKEVEYYHPMLLEFKNSKFMAAVVDHACKELNIVSVMGENSEDSIINALIDGHNLDAAVVYPLNQYLSKTLDESLHVIGKSIDDFFKNDGNSTKRFIPKPVAILLSLWNGLFVILNGTWYLRNTLTLFSMKWWLIAAWFLSPAFWLWFTLVPSAWYAPLGLIRWLWFDRRDYGLSLKRWQVVLICLLVPIVATIIFGLPGWFPLVVDPNTKHIYLRILPFL
ncbi:hypothetical protein [Neomoorella thermoacetica]|uniref:hypothetical protein n=1 Tax=Neomoorella thermoacetica TaxID=1525 RepID=UPI0008FB5892|nr:hypothetical protein [Moorella thermoacetica]APC08277.1 hypothetical protein MTJW_11110 [Moorella thermoacetica]